MPVSISAVVALRDTRHCVMCLTRVDRRPPMRYRYQPATVRRGCHRRVEWRTVRVNDRMAVYGVAGSGPPVVFIHGWELAPHVYRHALAQLARNNVRVFAPAVPGFAGASDRPFEERTLDSYVAWLGRFLEAVGIGPVILVGHSFGGAIAIQAAHDLPDRVSRLVLVNSIGGDARPGPGKSALSIHERPLWYWGAAALGEALSRNMFSHASATSTHAISPTALRDPGAVWRTAHIARTANLTAELNRIADRGLPVSLLWGRADRLIPRASFESLRESLRTPPVFTVAGGHGWLINDPKYFGNAMRTVLNWVPTGAAA
ncbi:alpha/beta fold hydrolase [Rhodococcus sp. NPDC057529]|uniref:alpha/beta fold hydrolase n=1 Tax=Rhodococcus sp. NPDC057529 TaxID=3346158 RepID=UPI00366F48E9